MYRPQRIQGHHEQHGHCDVEDAQVASVREPAARRRAEGGPDGDAGSIDNGVKDRAGDHRQRAAVGGCLGGDGPDGHDGTSWDCLTGRLPPSRSRMADLGAAVSRNGCEVSICQRQG